MKKLVVYQKPTCTTCRKLGKLLQNLEVEAEWIDYYEKPFTKTKLAQLLKKAGLKASEALRTKEEVYKKLKLAERRLSEDEYLDLLVRHPDLIQRPIVEYGDRAVLARPPEKVKELLK